MSLASDNVTGPHAAIAEALARAAETNPANPRNQNCPPRWGCVTGGPGSNPEATVWLRHGRPRRVLARTGTWLRRAVQEGPASNAPG